MMSSDAARRLLSAPKRSIRTAKQTLENCQENLQTLGSLLQKSVAADAAPAAASMPAVQPVRCLGGSRQGGVPAGCLLSISCAGVHR